MKRQTLQIGSALLATTALSSTAIAAVVGSASDTNEVALTGIVVSSQVFGATNPEAVTLGPTAFNFNFTNDLTAKFDMEIRSTNSDFVITSVPTIELFNASGGTVLTAMSTLSYSGCTVQVLIDRILVGDCLENTANASGIDVVQLSGIAFDEANGLATSGTAIALSGAVIGNTGGTFETITEASVITAANSLASVVRTGTAGSILNTSTPAFTKLSGTSTLTLNLGSVVTSDTQVTGTSLGALISTVPSNVASAINVKVTHGVLTDNATTNIIAGSATGIGNGLLVTRIPSDFVSNVASFGSQTVTTTTSLYGSFDLNVNFDGSDTIEAWAAGTVDVTYSVGGAVNLVAVPAATGSLAALNRAGMSVQINTAQSSTGAGATFQSLLRIVNNGVVAGAATITVLNDADGSTLGTHTTASIPAGATLQVSMPDIETGAGITPDGGQYGLSISGPFTGYAQHVMFNTATESLVDLSGFRIGSGTNNP
ncbi:MAG: hypothetical protein GKS03_06150 [Alphaproteobacteria bacterium]|nr:hypothetical protein [Alphaproteobacteria bacterium]